MNLEPHSSGDPVRIPTPADVQKRIEEEWTEESRNFLSEVVSRLNDSDSLEITITISDISTRSVNRVEKSLLAKGWATKVISGGHGSSNTLKIKGPELK